MTWHRAPHPLGRLAGADELRRIARSRRLGTGTLACPRCDAPVAPGARALSPRDPLGCPYCAHSGAARDFLSLAGPARPARVAVRVVAGRRAERPPALPQPPASTTS